MATVTTNNQYYTDIANAIREKNGTETQYKPSEMAAAIQAISGGGEPEPPDDGKTRLYITVPANAMEGLPPPRNQVPLYIQQTVANGVTIDWGDGTAPETLPGAGNVNTTHTYEQAGDYIISLDPAEGCELGVGWNDADYCITGPVESSAPYNVCSGMLNKVIIGKNITNIGNNAFQRYYSLSNIIITNGVTNIGSSTFQYCYGLLSLTIPEGVTEVGSYTCSNCVNLLSVTVPSSVMNIGAGVFGGGTFRYCYSMKEIHCLPAVPPAIGSIDIFASLPSDCVIYVPVGSLQAYQTATNWTAYADQMQEEPV